MRIFALLFLLTPLLLSAHKVNVFVKKEQEGIMVKAYFTKSSPCRECEVNLLDKEDKVIATKKSDASGEAFFELPQRDIQSVEVIASMGHKNVVEFFHKGEKKPLSLAFRLALAFVIFISLFLLLYVLKKRKK